MKNTKYIILLTAFVALFGSCVVEDGENPFYAPNEYGVYPIYTNVVNGFFDILDVNSASVGFTVEPSESGGAKSDNTGEVYVNFNGGTFSKISDVSAFPYTGTFALSEVITAIGGIDINNLTLDDMFSFRTYFNLTDGQRMTSGSLINVPMNCASDFGGSFDFVSSNMAATSPYASCGSTTTSGTVTFTNLGGGSYHISDLSFGQYAVCWGDSPATSGNAIITDSCLSLTSGGLDQYGLVYIWIITDISGSSMTISWSNDYGDSGVAVVTRPDGTNWPALFTN